MRGGGNLTDAAQRVDILRTVVEVVIANQTAVGFATQLAVFGFVNFLEHRALVPGGPLEALKVLGEFLLGHIEHADLQLRVRFGVADQIMQSAPCTLQRLELRGVQDEVELLGDLAVDLGDIRIDGLRNVIADDVAALQHLLGQGTHSQSHFFASAFAARAEFTVQQSRKVVGLRGLRLGVGKVLGSGILGRHEVTHPSTWGPRPASAAGWDP